MVFQGSDTPLEEDILKKKVEFIPTWTEWAAQNREQVKIEGTSGTIFTVADTETLFITSASLTVDTTTSAQRASAVMTIDGKQDTEVLLFCQNLTNQSSQATQNYSMPIKVDGNRTIQILVSGTGASAHATFQGFRIPKVIS